MFWTSVQGGVTMIIKICLNPSMVDHVFRVQLGFVKFFSHLEQVRDVFTHAVILRTANEYETCLNFEHFNG
jgi:hypothetical protein